jgi:hypothetical protein
MIDNNREVPVRGHLFRSISLAFEQAGHHQPLDVV